MNIKRQYKTYITGFRSEAIALLSEQGYIVQKLHLHWASQLVYSTTGNKKQKN